MIVTSNRAIAEWSDVFGEPLVASAARDRLAHDAHMVTIPSKSYRAQATGRQSANWLTIDEGKLNT